MTISMMQFASGGILLSGNETLPERAGKGSFRWVDICQPSAEDFAWLASTSDFHPLTIEDCQRFDQRAKVEEYDGYLFITMAVPRHLSLCEDLQGDELHAYIGAQYLVTVHAGPLDAVDRVRQWLVADRGRMKLSPDYLFYLLADILVDRYFIVLDSMEDAIDELEDKVVAGPDRETLNRIFRLKQSLVYLRKMAGPERELFHALSGRRFPLISSKTELYFRDIHDHLVRIYEVIEASRDLLGNALDAYLSSVSNQLSDVMKRLTVIATVFMPLSFIVGFGGMNFTAIPFDARWAFMAILMVMAVTPVSMLLWFQRREWM